MRLGFHGATSMTSDLETDVMATAHAGLKALELWAAKIDTYLSAHSLDDLKSLLAVQGVAPNQTEVWGCLSGLPHWPVSWPSSAKVGLERGRRRCRESACDPNSTPRVLGRQGAIQVRVTGPAQEGPVARSQPLPVAQNERCSTSRDSRWAMGRRRKGLILSLTLMIA